MYTLPAMKGGHGGKDSDGKNGDGILIACGIMRIV